MVARVKVTCLCGDIQDSVLLASDLPVKNITCSCNSCRYCTGVLYLSTLPLQTAPSFIDRLRPYRSSSKLTRFFCSKCGSHVLCRGGTKDGAWSLCTGVADGVVGAIITPTQIEQNVQHIFVGDTVDGGMAICLGASPVEPVSFFMQGPDHQPMNIVPNNLPSPYLPRFDVSKEGHPQNVDKGRSDLSSQKLRASCHCGGVEYFVSRPTEASKHCSSPWPDLLVPYHSNSSTNSEDVKWWLRAGDTKYLAGTCTCRSCRCASGVPIQTWAFVPKVNIEKPDGTPLDFQLGSIQQYSSSAGCYREFCNTCGASVFWHCDERPELIDVSVGLLRASEGSRAEDWLEWWTERVSFKEMAFDPTLIDGFERGLKVLRRP